MGKVVTDSEKKFLGAKDVSEMLSISESSSYRIIKKLNEELKAKGMIIIPGKISRRYFEEKIYM